MAAGLKTEPWQSASCLRRPSGRVPWLGPAGPRSTGPSPRRGRGRSKGGRTRLGKYHYFILRYFAA